MWKFVLRMRKKSCSIVTGTSVPSTPERMNSMNEYTDYLREQITEKISELSDEKLLYTIYAIIMEHVNRETQPEHP